MITLHTRIRNLPAATESALSAYSERFNRVAHHLLSDMQRTGKASTAFKNAYLARFGLTARQFNAVRIWVDGLIKNRVANLQLQIQTLSGKLNSAANTVRRIEKQIADVANDTDKTRKLRFKLHQKNRRKGNLEQRLALAQTALKERPNGICFGSRELFHKQYALKENGYADHAAWRREWRAARSDQFQVQGSNDETAGCDGCIAAIQEDGSILLRLQLPNDGGFLKIGPVRFPYQVDKLHAALTAHATINKRTLPLKPLKGKSQTVERQRRFRIYPDELTGLTWRFQRDDRGWRVSVSFTPVKPPVVTRIAAGAIGVDVNADHLACAELDRSGNPVETWNVLCVTYGKTTEQSEAIIEAAAIGIVRKAKTACKPIVLENLDFAKKKRALEEDGGKRYARMLSSLSYQKIQQAILARAAKEGVEVREVNPAFTSVIGRINYADRYGLTVHQGAAVAIGRRAFGLFKSHEKTGKPIKKFGFRENVLCRKADDGVKTVVAPDGRGGHVTFPYPEWNTRKHVWSLLSKVSRELKAALAARVRMTGRKRLRSSSDEHPPGGMVTVT